MPKILITIQYDYIEIYKFLVVKIKYIFLKNNCNISGMLKKS